MKLVQCLINFEADGWGIDKWLRYNTTSRIDLCVWIFQ